ncbi:hypothetical protein GEU84_004375 [Fertoebacter nigrum]|uniref:Peptidase M23 n=1 Tax=Fertoeibacter niger TaxID=2656921 RepID=A0A8X8KNB7_9RHOB|nr:hypothetical protein [Fertoeibacter niger]NUB43611.1 hypothetical protein [Fertoeibacter niger]
MKTSIAALILLPLPALAHEGAHLHPHGIQYGWVIACAVCFIGGMAVARIRGGRK